MKNMKIMKLLRLPMKQDIHNFYIIKKNEITCEIGHDYLFSVIYGFLQNSMQNGEITNEKGHGNKPNH